MLVEARRSCALVEIQVNFEPHFGSLWIAYYFAITMLVAAERVPWLR